MSIYTATFSGIAVNAAQDAFEIVAPANSRVAIREVRLGQYSDAGDAQAEMLSVTVERGYATSGSGGVAVTPANLMGHAGAPASTAAVERNNTTVATGGAPATLIADSWNAFASWHRARKHRQGRARDQAEPRPLQPGVGAVAIRDRRQRSRDQVRPGCRLRRPAAALPRRRQGAARRGRRHARSRAARPVSRSAASARSIARISPRGAAPTAWRSRKGARSSIPTWPSFSSRAAARSTAIRPA